MPTYIFKGYNVNGYRVGGAKRFASKSRMEEYLDSKKITNYDIFISATLYKPRMYSMVTPKELSIFCKQTSVLFFSNITLMEGVLVLAEQTENKQLKIALNEIYGHMEKGYTFADAICMYDHIFSTYLVNMTAIGETSGTLDVVFARMSDYYDKESKIRKKLKSAIAYPAILTTLMTAIVLLLILKVLPMFSEILSSMGGEIPSITRLILDVSSFISQYIFVIAAAIAALVIGVAYLARTEEGRFWLDKAKLKVPAIRFTNARIVTSRFSRSLSILLKSGVQLLNALEDISSLMDNKYLEKEFVNIIQKVKEGQDLSECLKEIEVFPVMFLKMVVIGQKTGNLDEMLDKSANMFDDEADEAIERLIVMLEPILIIILAIIVGIILISVMLPMISIMTTIG